MTWAEVIRKLKAAGFIEVRSGKGSHLLLKHPTSGKEVWVAVHTKKDAGRLGNRILREAKAERAIRDVLTAYLEAHPTSRPDARVRVARFSDRGKTKVAIVGVAALVGAQRSAAKARASRRNGRLGGRPRRAGAAARRRAKPPR